ncbi:MAG: PKD domain-containing protein [Ferruginibacter sp.]
MITVQIALATSHWLWNFADGGIDSVKNPTHTYTGFGIYQVKLSVNRFTVAVQILPNR